MIYAQTGLLIHARPRHRRRSFFGQHAALADTRGLRSRIEAL